jgi:hypothetical protein
MLQSTARTAASRLDFRVEAWGGGQSEAGKITLGNFRQAHSRRHKDWLLQCLAQWEQTSSLPLVCC